MGAVCVFVALFAPLSCLCPPFLMNYGSLNHFGFPAVKVVVVLLALAILVGHVLCLTVFRTRGYYFFLSFPSFCSSASFPLFGYFGSLLAGVYGFSWQLADCTLAPVTCSVAYVLPCAVSSCFVLLYLVMLHGVWSGVLLVAACCFASNLECAAPGLDFVLYIR